MLQKIHDLFHRYKHTFWPIIFWGWVIGVSLWLDSAEVTEIVSNASSGKFTNLDFSSMNFQQRYNDGKSLNVKAPNAQYDSSKRELNLQSPNLLWNDVPNERIFSASAELGLITVNVSQSALPSEFNLLNLQNNAVAQTQKVIVNSDQILFDNQNTLTIIKGPFTFRQSGKKGSIPKERVFDPITQNLYGTVEEALSARKQ